MISFDERAPATSAPPSPQPNSPRPVYTGAENLRRFCRDVISRMSEHMQQTQLEKVALYQQIWYLVAKYEVPISDPADDIVVVVDKLCRDDDTLMETLNAGTQLNK